MAADVLMSKAITDTVGQDVSLRVVGTQIPPARMSIQVAITGKAHVQIQGRLHKEAPWADIGEGHEKSCLFYIDLIWSLRAVSTNTGADSSVSVWLPGTSDFRSLLPKHDCPTRQCDWIRAELDTGLLDAILLANNFGSTVAGIDA